jgi:excisionase family DNA binding protein
MAQDEDDVLIDPVEARQRLGGISRSTFYELLKAGDIEGVRIGRKRLVVSSSIARFIATLRLKKGAAR